MVTVNGVPLLNVVLKSVMVVASCLCQSCSGLERGGLTKILADLVINLLGSLETAATINVSYFSFIRGCPRLFRPTQFSLG